VATSGSHPFTEKVATLATQLIPPSKTEKSSHKSGENFAVGFFQSQTGTESRAKVAKVATNQESVFCGQNSSLALDLETFAPIQRTKTGRIKKTGGALSP
jgi:hypothetical protein